MISSWFSKVNSVIPRGFSRHYILSLLKEKPRSGKEIIDCAIYESDGKWNPSPGAIYPMLGRLLEEGLVIEEENGKYKITNKGIKISEDIQSVHNVVQKQLDVMFRFGNMGKFMAMDLIDRVSTVGSTISSNLDKMTEQEREKYKKFLRTELDKIEEQEKELK
ncbi:MAG: helix-turn-helix transcriptional regulator [Nitrososphaeraceae archaeon]